MGKSILCQYFPVINPYYLTVFGLVYERQSRPERLAIGAVRPLLAVAAAVVHEWGLPLHVAGGGQGARAAADVTSGDLGVNNIKA